jgi:hypothetical protein
MAKVASVNVPFGASEAGPAIIWNLVQLLIANGWELFASSDGAGAAVTGFNSGANGLNNASAYVCVKDPSDPSPGTGGRKYLFQRGSGSQANWWIRYVRSAELLTAGTATVMPSNPAAVPGGAVDLQNIIGTSDTGEVLVSSATSAGYAHAVYETTPEFGVHQFWAAGTVAATGTVHGGLMTLGLDTVLPSGGLDQDPCISKAGGGTPSNVGAVTEWSCWTRYGMTGPSWSFKTAASSGGPSLSAAVNPYTANDDALGRVFGTGGAFSFMQPIKGSNSWMLWKASVDRPYPNTINLNTDAYVYLAGVLLPWPNTVTPQL